MKRNAGLVIAIDGVVGSGKTSTAREVARVLGYRHLDTGAMYRAVTLAARQAGVAAAETAALADLLSRIRITLLPQHQGGAVLLDGRDVSHRIRSPEITRAVGAYADLPLVRRALIAQQQRLGAEGGVVAEGRDIASVVFPDADLKIRMVADLRARALRRFRELTEKGVSISLEDVVTDIRQRDAEDAARDYGPCAPPTDVIELDTTGMTLNGQVEHIVSLARQRGA